MGRFTRFGALVGAGLLALTASPALSATYATPDGDGHPSVVLLTFWADADGGTVDFTTDADGDGFPDDYSWRCTGTLLSSTVVLTAGHCTVDGQRALAHVDYDSDTVHPAHDPASGVLGTPHGHPAYDDAWPAFPQTYDVGVVVLDEPVVGVDDFPTLAPVGALDTYTQRELKHDVVFETVGYGLQWIRGPWRYEGDWVRHQSWSTWVNATSANNADRDGDYSFQTSNNNGHTKGGSCFGDSGGPVFVHERGAEHADGHVIAGIVSFGMSPNCTGVDFSYRADQQLVHDFVGSFMAAG